MSVWDEIDRMKKAYEAELEATSNGVEAEGAVKGSTYSDEMKRWHCSYVPKGERRREHLQAASSAELIAKLKAIRAAENPKGESVPTKGRN